MYHLDKNIQQLNLLSSIHFLDLSTHLQFEFRKPSILFLNFSFG